MINIWLLAFIIRKDTTAVATLSACITREVANGDLAMETESSGAKAGVLLTSLSGSKSYPLWINVYLDPTREYNVLMRA